MKKSTKILSLFLGLLLVVLQLCSLFHSFNHLQKKDTAGISLVEKKDGHNVSQNKYCLLCDFFLYTEPALLSIFTTIIFISLLLSSSIKEHILKKKITYILYKKSRAPPYLI